MLDSHSYSPLTGLSGGERIIIRGGKTGRFDVPVRMFPFTELRGWLEQAGFENVRATDGTASHSRSTILG